MADKQCSSCGGLCRGPCERDDVHPTHCIDCRWSVFGLGACCTNPGVESLSDDDRRLYDDPLQPCPLFEAKPIVIVED